MNTYTAHQSPYSILGKGAIAAASMSEQTLSIEGYLEIEDVNGKSHEIQIVKKGNICNIAKCDVLIITFQMENAIITNTYKTVFCDNLGQFLPIWELIEQTRQIAGISVYSWTLQQDADWYENERKAYFKQSGKGEFKLQHWTVKHQEPQETVSEVVESDESIDVDTSLFSEEEQKPSRTRRPRYNEKRYDNKFVM